MPSIQSGLRQVFAGRTVGVILGILVAGTVLISSGFVPGYLAMLFASGLRNAHFAWIGDGPLLYAVAFGFLYLEAVLLAAVYLVARAAYRSVGRFGERATA